MVWRKLSICTSTVYTIVATAGWLDVISLECSLHDTACKAERFNRHCSTLDMQSYDGSRPIFAHSRLKFRLFYTVGSLTLIHCEAMASQHASAARLLIRSSRSPMSSARQSRQTSPLRLVCKIVPVKSSFFRTLFCFAQPHACHVSCNRAGLYVVHSVHRSSAGPRNAPLLPMLLPADLQRLLGSAS